MIATARSAASATVVASANSVSNRWSSSSWRRPRTRSVVSMAVDMVPARPPWSPRRAVRAEVRNISRRWTVKGASSTTRGRPVSSISRWRGPLVAHSSGHASRRGRPTTRAKSAPSRRREASLGSTTRSGPQWTITGRGLSSMVRTTAPRLVGHVATGPSGVADQSTARRRAAASVSPTKTRSRAAASSDDSGGAAPLPTTSTRRGPISSRASTRSTAPAATAADGTGSPWATTVPPASFTARAPAAPSRPEPASTTTIVRAPWVSARDSRRMSPGRSWGRMAGTTDTVPSGSTTIPLAGGHSSTSPGTSFWPSAAHPTGSRMRRRRIDARARPWSERCWSTTTGAGKSGGRLRRTVARASTPPPDPTTAITSNAGPSNAGTSNAGSSTVRTLFSRG